MQTLRDGFLNSPVWRSAALVALALTTVLVTLQIADAQDPLVPPNPVTYCDAATPIELGTIVDGSPQPVPGIVLARGASVELRNGSPILRLDGRGSRVQVSLPEVMFHTQWVMTHVDRNDRVRVDASGGGAVRSLESVSQFGVFSGVPERADSGVIAIGAGDGGTAQIDLHTGADNILFTNDGDSRIDIALATGCPVLAVDHSVVSPPTWDPELQRFVGRYTVSFGSQLPDRRDLARLVQPRQTTVQPGEVEAIEDLVLDLDLRAPGFGAGEILRFDMPNFLDRFRSESFDGALDTRVLNQPRRLTSRAMQRLELEVAFAPNFNDPTWQESIAPPAPTFIVRGTVDGIAVRTEVDLGTADQESSEVSAFVAPQSAIELRHDQVAEPIVHPDGSVSISERITITNAGDTNLNRAVASYNLVEAYGPGTVIRSLELGASGACRSEQVAQYDGGNSGSTLVSFEQAFRVGETCTLDLNSVLIPGTIPSAFGSDYQGSVNVAAQLGLQQVTARTVVESTITQVAELAIQPETVTATNEGDGSYLLVGSVRLINSGDQNVDLSTLRLDVSSANSDGVQIPRWVGVERLRGLGRNCVVIEPPSRFVTGFAALPSVDALQLAPEGECIVEFAVRAVPQADLEEWTFTARAEGVSSRRQPVATVVETEPFTLVEAPGTDVSIRTTRPANNGDGTYTFEIDMSAENSGDVPLTDVLIVDDLLERFDGKIISKRLLSNTCVAITTGRPMRTSGDRSSCEVRYLVVARPGAVLKDWTFVAEALSVSVSTADASTQESAETFEFVEAPAMSTALDVVSSEKVDDRSYALVLRGNVTNTGDILLSNTNVTVDLANTFGTSPFTISGTSSRELNMSDTFNGTGDLSVLPGTAQIEVGGSRTFWIALTVESADDPGPFVFQGNANALSPAEKTIGASSEPASLALPLLTTVDRQISQINNNDGTYDVTHSARIRNIGEAPLERIWAVTDFDSVLGNILIGVPTITTNCGAGALGVGESCQITTTGTIRPGELVGPYSVGVFTGGTTGSDLAALVIPEPTNTHIEARLNQPLVLPEAPSIATEITRTAPINNGDGTYSLTYTFDVSNTGDVPLYDVDTSNGAVDTFGARVSEYQRPIDSCGRIGFRTPLAVGETCTVQHDIRVRPESELGPWTVSFDAGATSPAANVVTDGGSAAAVSFTESVSISTDSSLLVRRSNGNGTYNVVTAIAVENTSDVPLISVDASQGEAVFADLIVEADLLVDSCAQVSFENPLGPGQTCEIQTDLLVRPGEKLGPWTLSASAKANSPSGESTDGSSESSPLTLVENIATTTRAELQSVENNGDGSFRVITDLWFSNDGDVEIQDAQLELALADAFSETEYRVDGVFSRSVDLDDRFALGEVSTLLAEPITLHPGQDGRITLILSVRPGDSVGPFNAPLVLTGVSPAGVEVAESIEASVDLPALTVAIAEQTVDNNRNGSYTVITTYELTNSGTTELVDLHLYEDLSAAYPGTAARLTAVSSDTLSVIKPSDRTRGSDVLVRPATLGVGERASVVSTVVVTPGNALGPFLPGVWFSGESPTETPVAAQADAPSDIVFVEQPALLVTQQLSSRPVWDSNGRFDVTFEVTVTNDGDIELRNLQVREDLLNALGSGSTIIVRDVQSDTLTPNDGFDGLGVRPTDPAAETDDRPQRIWGDTRLLSGWDTLPAGESATILLELTIIPENRGVYSTRVVASALSPAGTGIGSDAPIEAATLTRLTVQGELGVAKTVVGEPEVQADGSLNVTYELRVQNAGPFPLSEVAVHDQLTQAYGVGSLFDTSTIRTEAESVCRGFTNTDYDGGTSNSVLASGFALAPGETCRLQYDVVVVPAKPLPGPYRSSAFALASDPFGEAVIDDSTDGIDPDPDGNQEPGDNDIATAVSVTPPVPMLGVEIEPLDVSRGRDQDWYDLTYRVTIENNGTIDIASTRLVLTLEEQLSDRFRVRESESDSLQLNSSFDGDREVRLLTLRNRLRAGESESLDLTISVRSTQEVELPLTVTFDAVSAAGTQTQDTGSTATSTATIDLANASRALSLRQLTDGERNMLLLGGAAFLLIAAVFVRRVVTSVRRSQRLRRYIADGDRVIDLRVSRRIIDLREGQRTSDGARHTRDKSHGSRRRRTRKRERTSR